MFIDIHVHTRRTPGFPRVTGDKMTYATPDQLMAAYDEMGIERGVLLPGVCPECNCVPQCNEDSLELAKAYNGRFIPFCNIDPRNINNSWRAPLDKMMLYYKERGCKGVGEVTANIPILDPMVQNLFRCAEIADMPVTVHLSPYVGHAYGLVDDSGLPQLEETLKRFPKLKIFGHSQTFWAEMSTINTIEDRFGYPKGPVTEGAVPRLMRQYPNLYGDLSAGSGCNALTRDPEYAVKFLTEFQDRLFFGTDVAQPTMPTLRGLATFLKDLLAKGAISQTVFNKIARENAIRVLGLDSAL